MVSQSALPRRTLGRTGFEVSILGFGTAPLGDLFLELDDQTAIAAVQAAPSSSASICSIHRRTMAMACRNIAVERRSGACHARTWCFAPRPVAGWIHFISQKLGPDLSADSRTRAVVDYSYDGTMRSVEQSLLRLGTDRIDLLLIHDVDVWTHGKDAIEDRFREAMSGAYVALDKLRAEGVVAGIGIGVNEAEMCVRFAQAGSFDVMLLAGRYSLLEQPALEEFMPLALKQGIAVLLGGVFNSGILATGATKGAKYNYQDAPPQILSKVAEIQRICAAHGVALANGCTTFRARIIPRSTSVVLGAHNAQEVERNVAALSATVPAALWSDLKAARLLESEAPVPR